MPTATSATSSPSSPSSPYPAGVWRRLAALVYDSFLLFGLLFITGGIYVAVDAGLAGVPIAADVQTGSVITDLPKHRSPLLFALEVLVVGGFYIYFWRRNGQTLGMQAWRLRLDDAAAGGARPSTRQCLLRLAVGLVSLACAGLGYWWLWIDKERRTWHDRASNTQVVVLPKR
jgi:uncharacterized RDD family membrane protein YckC